MPELLTKTLFISYAHEDIKWADEACHQARRYGIRVYIDKTSLEAGDRLSDTIFQRIREADSFLLGWSANASQSDWVRQEYEEALRINDDRPNFLMIDLLDRTPLPEALTDILAEPSAVRAGRSVPAWTLAAVAIATAAVLLVLAPLPGIVFVFGIAGAFSRPTDASTVSFVMEFIWSSFANPETWGAFNAKAIGHLIGGVFSSSLPSLVVWMALIIALIGVPKRGEAFRAPGRLLLAFGGREWHPLSIAYSIGTVIVIVIAALVI